MATVFDGSGSQSPTSLSRTIEKVFDESQYTGEINLSGRKLKEYPKCACKYDLVDITSAGKHQSFFFFFIRGTGTHNSQRDMNRLFLATNYCYQPPATHLTLCGFFAGGNKRLDEWVQPE